MVEEVNTRMKKLETRIDLQEKNRLAMNEASWLIDLARLFTTYHLAIKPVLRAIDIAKADQLALPADFYHTRRL